MVRIKERYILVNVISPPSSSKPTSPDVPDYASRKYYRLVWAALTMMNHIPGSSTSCVFRVVHISGTIRKAEEEAIRRARRFILAAKDVAANKTRNETFYATFDSGENIMDIDGSSDCGDE
ncbi:hypothetical protein CFIMG_007192RA00001 [Ceratocystis fimbriata CBS 114723]|uniref:Ribonuclease P/MRP protein subunit POP5 n=1 Tax=Ceratocystis fimbriata CBS 114723 TaxID=1035309 RepID=A0A2C5XB69_9PEZI|nr:hypothetical protein CFIMG_007192RA00001 [Ceratocystis fimbriata CBS 114723]